jgi:hypothetical protein
VGSNPTPPATPNPGHGRVQKNKVKIKLIDYLKLDLQFITHIKCQSQRYERRKELYTRLPFSWHSTQLKLMEKKNQ